MILHTYLLIKYDCLVHPGVQNRRRMSDIHLSQPRYETAFWWCHNGRVTSQLTDTTKWPNYPLEFIRTQISCSSKNVKLCLIFCIYLYSLIGWHALFCIKNNRHNVTITTRAIMCHFLIWMKTVTQPRKCWCSWVLTLKYTFICVSWWTRQRIHNTFIMVDRYLRLMGDKMIPELAEPRLESFYLPFIAGIDLPHQGVEDSYDPTDHSATNELHLYVSHSYNALKLHLD